MKFLLSAALIALLPAAQLVYAGSATWNLNPTSDDWNSASNWTPATVPNGPDDTATFARSNAPAADITADTEVNGIVFSPSAKVGTITSTAQQVLTISGAGIVNNSGVRQNFVADQDPDGGDGGKILFTNSATAGTGTRFTVIGGQEYLYGIGGVVAFADSSSADHASFEVFGAEPFAFEAGALSFGDTSTAGNATILLHAGGGYDANLDIVSDATAGNATVTNQGGFFYFWNSATAGNSTLINDYGPIVFRDSTSADHAVITNNGGFPEREFIGSTSFWNIATAANGIFINNGGTGSGSVGGFTGFTSDSPTAGNATLIANSGVDGGGGGQIVFTHGDGGTARIEVFGNGTLDMSGHSGIPPLAIGSLEGDGLVLLGGNGLTIGGNNLSTTFSGSIQGSSALTKIGKGKLNLTGASSYTRGTTVSGGTLMVGNTIGSATGPGRLKVTAGSLGGTGIIVGPVIVGTGSGRGATLSPGTRKNLGTLTMQNELTLNPDATYAFVLDSTLVSSATLSVKGVIISTGALFSAVDNGNAALPLGTTFTAIKNTALHVTIGTFSNLPDGSTITIGSNTFQANYEGGDGNDLTLTVVP